MTCDTAAALTRTEWPMAQLHEHILLAFRKLRGKDWLKDIFARMEPKFPDATAYNPTFWILPLGSLKPNVLSRKGPITQVSAEEGLSRED